MKTSSIIVTIFSLLFTFSCSKKTNDLTTVTLTMPDLSGSEILSTNSAVTDPSTINEINCYAILVSGPDNILSRTTCPIVNASGTAIANTLAKKIGMIRGLVPSNGQITLNVPPGANRQFILVGIKADPITSCISFDSPDANLDFTSAPFIIGESAPVSLEPGTETNVLIQRPPVNTPFSANSPRLGDCVGPDALVNRNKVFPTKAIITKNFFPYNAFRENTCNGLNIEFTDNLGRRGQVDSAFTMAIGSTPLTTFTGLSYYDNGVCSGSPIASTISIPAFTKSKQISFISDVSTSASAYVFQLTNFSNSFPNFQTAAFENNPSNYQSIDVHGLRSIIPNICYNLVGYFKDYNMQPVIGTSYTVTLPDVSAKLWDSKNCGDIAGSNPAISFPGGTGNALTAADNFDFSVKFTNTPYQLTSFTLTPTSGTSITAINYPIEVVGGTRNPTALRTDLPVILPSTPATCHGPFQVVIENERGGAIPTTGSINISIGGGVQVKSTCATSYSAVMPFVDYRKVFYLYNPSATGAATLTITGSIINPSTLTGVSLTTTRNFMFQ